MNHIHDHDMLLLFTTSAANTCWGYLDLNPVKSHTVNIMVSIEPKAAAQAACCREHVDPFHANPHHWRQHSHPIGLPLQQELLQHLQTHHRIRHRIWVGEPVPSASKMLINTLGTSIGEDQFPDDLRGPWGKLFWVFPFWTEVTDPSPSPVFRSRFFGGERRMLLILSFHQDTAFLAAFEIVDLGRFSSFADARVLLFCLGVVKVVGSRHWWISLVSIWLFNGVAIREIQSIFALINPLQNQYVLLLG
jgi:hypothetical protein